MKAERGELPGGAVIWQNPSAGQGYSTEGKADACYEPPPPVDQFSVEPARV